MSRDADWGVNFGGLTADAGRPYDEVLVPRMFEPWARLLADELAVAPGEAVLDVACGPGSATRVLAARVGPSGRVTGCDLSEGMLATARSKPPVGDGAEIEYLAAPADALPVGDAEFDLVTCQQGLQFFPDRPRALAEMRRVLRPGGRVGIAVWRAIAEVPPFEAVRQAIAEVAGSELAERYAAGPWGFPDPEQLGALVEQAGFDDVEVSTHELPLEFEGASQILLTLAATPLAAKIDALAPEQKRRLHEELASRVGDGAVESSARSNIALARRA